MKETTLIYEVRNKYQADALAYLGFRYYKKGFGAETVYTFEETEILIGAIKQMNGIKNRVKNQRFQLA